MGIVGIVRKTGSKILSKGGSRVGKRGAAAAGAGAGAGAGLFADDAVDFVTPDIPGLGGDSGGGLPIIEIMLVLGAVVALGQLFNINIGDSTE